MHLTVQEREKLMMYLAADMAEKRLLRGVKLNYPEAIAYITGFVIEGARDGKSVSELMEEARHLLTTEQVMEGVAELLSEVQVEATFTDGTKLVSVHDPIPRPLGGMTPGEYEFADDPIVLLPDRKRISRSVTNTGSRPVQVGSHFHFCEANPALSFNREGTKGYRLDIPSGLSVRIEPGETTEVELVEIGGLKEIHGFAGLTNGRVE
ncbi:MULTISPECIES: urease subunit gamma [unclassified Paenibacillus]|uniref:urease subunit gamma n=1 Tax=unclassified Paenibacillus TaxID=185978 RepID=UPI0009A7396B|nr:MULTISPECIES: urease subunit gamma [unclassified Paenibacillus]SLK20987.1 urease subunit gamma/beta [Paenibacillus sp. RU5A]SOC76413.1 urease subunit gamma/beta [Paenibacillus sp. RU26A]SOC77912.1 urease subunit gamma/beta [Paenibacillus sp. RU5M]